MSRGFDGRGVGLPHKSIPAKNRKATLSQSAKATLRQSANVARQGFVFSKFYEPTLL